MLNIVMQHLACRFTLLHPLSPCSPFWPRMSPQSGSAWTHHGAQDLVKSTLSTFFRHWDETNFNPGSNGRCNRTVPERFHQIMSAFQDVFYLRGPTSIPALYPQALGIIPFYLGCAFFAARACRPATLSPTCVKSKLIYFSLL